MRQSLCPRVESRSARNNKLLAPPVFFCPRTARRRRILVGRRSYGRQIGRLRLILAIERSWERCRPHRDRHIAIRWRNVVEREADRTGPQERGDAPLACCPCFARAARRAPRHRAGESLRGRANDLSDRGDDSTTSGFGFSRGAGCRPARHHGPPGRIGCALVKISASGPDADFEKCDKTPGPISTLSNAWLTASGLNREPGRPDQADDLAGRLPPPPHCRASSHHRSKHRTPRRCPPAALIGLRSIGANNTVLGIAMVGGRVGEQLREVAEAFASRAAPGSRRIRRPHRARTVERQAYVEKTPFARNAQPPGPPRSGRQTRPIPGRAHQGIDRQAFPRRARKGGERHGRFQRVVDE